MTKPREISASEFRAKCLKLMDEVAATGEELIITKRGTPVARLVPVKEARPRLFGSMKSTFKILGDIVEPVMEPGWEEEMLRSWDEVQGLDPTESHGDE